MIEKFEDLEKKYVELEKKLSDPEIIADGDQYRTHVKRHAELKDGIADYRQYKKVTQDIAEAKELLKDPELSQVAKEELSSLEPQQALLKEKLQLFLIPKDKNDRKNVLVEIRSGTGGDEAALFAADLYRMYARFSENMGWKIEILSQNITEKGGLKEIVFSVSGGAIYGYLKFEMGTHRVQRVPDTEASGRIHTSAATVAILPEPEDVDIQIETKDLRVDTFRASGAGGQHVNKTSSAVRITHLPTGIVVACQDERSQFQNKDRCLRMLKTKLYEQQVNAQRTSEAALRKSQVGTGDRSQKIRTYNFPQKRVTDHRINVSIYNLEEFLNGKILEIIEALQSAERIAKMKQ